MSLRHRGGWVSPLGVARKPGGCDPATRPAALEGVIDVAGNASRPRSSRPTVTARQWQYAYGQAAVDWMGSSGVAQRMLADICAAVETTVQWVLGSDSARARQVIEQYPEVLSRCDHLQFGDPAQALAYLILHLPDRYCRMFQVLERLLLSARLPLGRSGDFAAIDIGAGPGPGIFAIRSFYAALACYARLHDPSWRVATLGYTHVVERSEAMPWIMHRFAEALIIMEQGGGDTDADCRREANPCLEQLKQSSVPFGADYADFSGLDVQEEHQRARRSLADELYWDDSLELSRAGANRLAYTEPIGRPSSYALASMMNFLTPTDDVPDAISKFSEAIDRLMRGSLVPGGTILVLGGPGNKYQEIYAELDRRARAAHLNVLDGFDRPLQAGHRADERAAIRELTRGIWSKLESLAGDVSQTKEKLREIGQDKIFDRSKRFRFPDFRVRAYRRGL
jgi:hypothetical protein